jgi:hypothetical protein
MTLLCDLGWHQPAPVPRWKQGFYVSKCLRCERDLLRTLRGPWSVRDDILVRWTRTAPKFGAEGYGADAIISPVPATAQAEAVEPDRPPPVAQPPAAAAAPGAADRGNQAPIERAGDFMDEGSIREGRATADAAYAQQDKGRDASSGRPARESESPPPQNRHERPVMGMAALVAAAVLLGALLAIAGEALVSPGQSNGAAATSPPASATAPPPMREPAPVEAAGQGQAMVAMRGGACTRWEHRRIRRLSSDVELWVVEPHGRRTILSRAGTPCWTLRIGNRP